MNTFTFHSLIMTLARRGLVHALACTLAPSAECSNKITQPIQFLLLATFIINIPSIFSLTLKTSQCNFNSISAEKITTTWIFFTFFRPMRLKMMVLFSKMNKNKHFHSFDIIFVQLNWSKNEKIIQVVVIFLLKWSWSYAERS